MNIEPIKPPELSDSELGYIKAQGKAGKRVVYAFNVNQEHLSGLYLIMNSLGLIHKSDMIYNLAGEGNPKWEGDIPYVMIRRALMRETSIK